MTDKKTEALKLALEALEFYENDNHVTYAIGPDWAGSRERLENRGYTCVNGDTNMYVERGAKAEAAATALRAALAEQPAEQEPVGKVIVKQHGETTIVDFEFDFDVAELLTAGAHPAYTAPQPTKRQQLTDEEICAALGIDGSDDWTFTVAYAVIAAYERKNGIGGQP